MMEQKEFEKKMENLNVPKLKVTEHQQAFRATLMNTKKSLFWGVIFLILPFLFLSGVLLKHYLEVDAWIFTGVYEWIGEQDRLYGDRSLVNWIIRLLLLFGPLVAIAFNLFAILHIQYDRTLKEIIIAVKLRWLNLAIVFLCSLIFGVFFLYLVIENS